jgi:hypothetical protein
MPVQFALLLALGGALIAGSCATSFHILDSNGTDVTNQSLTFAKDSRVELTCTFNMSSDSGTALSESLIWTRNGNVVASSTPTGVHQVFVNGTQQLVISSLTVANRGVYSCVRNDSSPRTSLDVVILLNTDVCKCHPNATCERGPLGIPRCRCNPLFYGNGTYCGK